MLPAAWSTRTPTPAGMRRAVATRMTRLASPTRPPATIPLITSGWRASSVSRVTATRPATRARLASRWKDRSSLIALASSSALPERRYTHPPQSPAPGRQARTTETCGPADRPASPARVRRGPTPRTGCRCLTRDRAPTACWAPCDCSPGPSAAPRTPQAITAYQAMNSGCNRAATLSAPQATRNNDRDSQQQQDDGALQHAVVAVDGKADRGENGGPEIKDQGRLPRTQAKVQQPVVEVLRIGLGDGPAPPPSPDDGPGGVQDGDDEGQDRNRQGKDHRSLGHRQDRDGGQREAQEVAAR